MIIILLSIFVMGGGTVAMLKILNIPRLTVVTLRITFCLDIILLSSTIIVYCVFLG
jgi:hypothetical protein